MALKVNDKVKVVARAHARHGREGFVTGPGRGRDRYLVNFGQGAVDDMLERDLEKIEDKGKWDHKHGLAGKATDFTAASGRAVPATRPGRHRLAQERHGGARGAVLRQFRDCAADIPARCERAWRFLQERRARLCQSRGVLACRRAVGVHAVRARPGRRLLTPKFRAFAAVCGSASVSLATPAAGLRTHR